MSTKASVLLATLLVGKLRPVIKSILKENIDFQTTDTRRRAIFEASGQNPVYGRDVFDAYQYNGEIIGWDITHHTMGVGMVIASAEDKIGTLVNVPKVKGDVKTFKSLIANFIGDVIPVITPPNNPVDIPYKALMCLLTASGAKYSVALDTTGKPYIVTEQYYITYEGRKFHTHHKS